jgi:hypothetical protein
MWSVDRICLFWEFVQTPLSPWSRAGEQGTIPVAHLSSPKRIG